MCREDGKRGKITYRSLYALYCCLFRRMFLPPQSLKLGMFIFVLLSIYD